MSRSVNCIAYIALFVALMSMPCAVGQDLRLFATVDGASDYAQAIAKGRRIVHASMEQGNPGMSIAVGVHGEIVWAGGRGRFGDALGRADEATRSPVQSDSYG